MDIALTAAAVAVEQIPVGSTVVISPTCGTPTSLLPTLAERSANKNWTVLSGLIFDPSDLLHAVEHNGLGWNTWHPTSACNDLLTEGLINYIPLRASQVPKHILRWEPAATVVRITPPDRHGWCSLGPSVGYALTLREGSAPEDRRDRPVVAPYMGSEHGARLSVRLPVRQQQPDARLRRCTPR